MHRVLSLSIVAALALGAADVASAQSRTVSTADLPRPGVSYIQGPSVPVRRETVTTATLPEPAHLYVGGKAAEGPGDRRNGDDYPDVPTATAEYGGGYFPAYGWNGRGRDDRGHDHGHPGDGRPGGNYGGGHDGHDHGDRPHGSTSNTFAVSGGPTNATGPALKMAPQRPADRNPRLNPNAAGNPPPRPGPAPSVPVRTGGWRGHGR